MHECLCMHISMHECVLHFIKQNMFVRMHARVRMGTIFSRRMHACVLYACMHIRMHAHMFVCMHARTCCTGVLHFTEEYMHMYYMYVYSCMYVYYMYVCICTSFTRGFMRCMYACMHVCMYVNFPVWWYIFFVHVCI